MNKLKQAFNQVNLQTIKSGSIQALNLAAEVANLTQSAIRGPIRNALLVGKEVSKTVNKEQKLIPEIKDWPLAKQEYKALLNLRPKDLRNVTVQQATYFLQSFGQVTAFFFIGYSIGKVINKVSD